jgi:hypothetical protein
VGHTPYRWFFGGGGFGVRAVAEQQLAHSLVRGGFGVRYTIRTVAGQHVTDFLVIGVPGLGLVIGGVLVFREGFHCHVDKSATIWVGLDRTNAKSDRRVMGLWLRRVIGLWLRRNIEQFGVFNVLLNYAFDCLIR